MKGGVYRMLTNKQVYFGTCITSQAIGSTLRRLAVIDRVKRLSDTALRT